MVAGRGGYRGRRSNEPRRPNPRENERTRMLSLNNSTVFRYGMREIMSNYKVDENAAKSLIASVIAKASRISIDSAKRFMEEQEALGVCSKEATDEVFSLLERFSTFR